MKGYLLTVFITCLVSFSCNSKGDDSKATEFYNLILSTSKATNIAQDRFLQEFVQTIDTADNNVVIHTEYLSKLLDSAQSATLQEIGIINTLEETDEDIKLKGKALEFDNLFDSLCSSEFKDCLNVLDNQEGDRYERCIKLLQPRYPVRLKELRRQFVNAGEDFSKKYGIKLYDVSSKINSQ